MSIPTAVGRLRIKTKHNDVKTTVRAETLTVQSEPHEVVAHPIDDVTWNMEAIQAEGFSKTELFGTDMPEPNETILGHIVDGAVYVLSKSDD